MNSIKLKANIDLELLSISRELSICIMQPILSINFKVSLNYIYSRILRELNKCERKYVLFSNQKLG